MVHSQSGIHHKHLRERDENKKLTKDEKWKKFLDKIIYFVGISGPIMTIPQVLKVWVEKDAAGVSLISWSWYLATAFIWLGYGIVHKEKPLIITYILWIIIQAILVVGILLYK